MAKPLKLLPFPKYVPQDLATTQLVFIPDPDVLQLQSDVLNVLEGRVKITTFDPKYQKKIKDYWRFSATVQNSKSNNLANRTNDTLDLV